VISYLPCFTLSLKRHLTENVLKDYLRMLLSAIYDLSGDILRLSGVQFYHSRIHLAHSNLIHQPETGCQTDSRYRVISLTQFLRSLERFIINFNVSCICKIRDTGSGQILQTRQLYPSPVSIVIRIAKIESWC
jgi:hypothetical protein